MGDVGSRIFENMATWLDGKEGAQIAPLLFNHRIFRLGSFLVLGRIL